MRHAVFSNQFLLALHASLRSLFSKVSYGGMLKMSSVELAIPLRLVRLISSQLPVGAFALNTLLRPPGLETKPNLGLGFSVRLNTRSLLWTALFFLG